jgi:hypothetical protein
VGRIRKAVALISAAVAACTTTPPHEYVPSAHHSHRPPGAIYNDEVGENVLTASRHRIIQVFGPPASVRSGRCLQYRIVHSPHERWEFCFHPDGEMSGAMVIRPG